MERFLQIHTLTNYAPSNLNRDETGRPKTAIIGGRPRLRISSQSLKRAWRMSDVFRDTLDGHLGQRTRRIGERVAEGLASRGIKEEDAVAWAAKVASQFGTVEEGGVKMSQLAHVSPVELAAIDALTATLAKAKREPTEDELTLLRKSTKASDISMFGRMLAESPSFNVDAAVQVAHAFTIHPVTVEDDYFSAVDDLQTHADEEGAGSGHIGAHEFGAGVFYNYVCVNRELLVQNLDGDEALAKRSLDALVRALLTVPPSGKQNSYASRAYASYALAEIGNRQPRSLAVAFLDGVDAPYLTRGIESLGRHRKHIDDVYGPVASAHYELDTLNGKGKVTDLVAFAQR